MANNPSPAYQPLDQLDPELFAVDKAYKATLCRDDARLPSPLPNAEVRGSSPENQQETIGRLQSLIREQETLIRCQAEALSHSQQIFEHASAAARIGVWECDLSDNSLTWSDVVYDLFDLPRGSVPDRADTIECYSVESRNALQAVRSQAIAERSGFTLDAEIVTPKGRRRWIRLTATVQCENDVPTRIFGMKQDITEEKILSDRTRHLAEFDSMTGLANRHQFQDRLAAVKDGARPPLGALLLVDLDGFKQINDTFGHALGDLCLAEMAQRLGAACQDAELVARIGGDEFAVLLGDHHDGAGLEVYAARIVEALNRPVYCGGELLAVSASVGIAVARSEDCVPSDLFRKADHALYAAKAAGRNTFRSFQNTA